MALLWGVVALSSLFLRPFWLAAAPLMPACPFRTITGAPCPSCGTTHAAVALLEGRVLDAFSANPLAAIAGVLFVAGGVLAPVWAALNGPMLEIPVPLPRWLRAAILGALLADWAYVIATG